MHWRRARRGRGYCATTETMSVLGRQLATAYGRLIRGDVFDAMETLLVELLALARWPAVDAGLSWGGFRISAG